MRRRVVLPFAALRRLREHDDRASERGGDVGRSRQLCREPFDRRGLSDVERLSCRDGSCVVEEDDRAGDVAPREEVRNLAAQLARAEDRD